MARDYGLDAAEQLRTLELVSWLSSGEHDGELATPDEHPPPAKPGEPARDPLDLEEFVGDGSLSHQPPDYVTSPADPCLAKIARNVLPRLESVPLIRWWRDQLGPRMSLLRLFDELSIDPACLLDVADLDTAGRQLAARPAYALPAYFGPLVEHFVAPRMAERFLELL